MAPYERRVTGLINIINGNELFTGQLPFNITVEFDDAILNNLLHISHSSLDISDFYDILGGNPLPRPIMTPA